MSRLEQKKRERENKATMEADMQQALAEKEVIAKQVGQFAVHAGSKGQSLGLRLHSEGVIRVSGLCTHYTPHPL